MSELRKLSSLASGHLHLPKVSAGARWSRTELIKGVNEALRKFLLDRFRLRSLGNVTFFNTAINTTSAPRPLTAMNDTNETISVATVMVTPPFALATMLPVSVNANSILSLQFTFTPPTVGTHTDLVVMRDASGEALFTATLTGKGIPLPPPPQITRFAPTSGFEGDTVTIFGANLDGATVVKIGTVSISISSVASTQITAEVSGPSIVGKISVDTPSGTAVSSGSFIVRRRPSPREELGAQLQARRAELGLQPRDAAGQLGVTSKTYTRWERGQDEPETRYRPAIDRFLGQEPGGESETLGERIRAARERDGLSRPQLAQRLGVSASTVQTWEAGTVSRPTPRVTRIFEDYVNEV